MSKKVFVFCGYKGSGKDTSSELFMNSLNLPFKHLSFADKLKMVCWELYSSKLVTPNRIYGNKDQKEEAIEGWVIDEHIRKSCNFTEHLWSGRRLLQWFGTEVGRYSYKDIWSDSLKKNLFERQENLFTITDCRFLSEYDMLKSLDKNFYDVIFVLIKRNVEYNDYCLHASELEVDKFKFDFIINNDGSIDNLRSNLEVLKICL
jgi:hypothetical protein